MRKRYPDAYIVTLCNTYNAPILENNLDIDKIEAYKKAKHRGASESLFSVYFDKLKMLFRLRRERFDYIIVASSTEKKRDWNLAKLLGPSSVVGYVGHFIKPKMGDLTITAPPNSKEKDRHEVEYVFDLFKLLGVRPPIPAMQLHKKLSSSAKSEAIVIGIQISSRKIGQRWPVENFSNLIKNINKKFNVNFLIFWSPGDANTPTHPGDDDLAIKLLELCTQEPIELYPTDSLSNLITGLSLCDYVVCSDGGGMHIAAALKKSIVCLFGNSNAKQWYPWGVSYELLQLNSKNVADIQVNMVLSSFEKLIKN